MSVLATPGRSSRITMSRGAQFLGGALAVVGATLLMTDPAAAQALQPVVRATTIIRDTVVGIALLVMTAAIGIAGFRVAFSGASFRDVSNLVMGGALAGGAAAIAAIFVA
jgi:type IV secretion system protein VirB2